MTYRIDITTPKAAQDAAQFESVLSAIISGLIAEGHTDNHESGRTLVDDYVLDDFGINANRERDGLNGIMWSAARRGGCRATREADEQEVDPYDRFFDAMDASTTDDGRETAAIDGMLNAIENRDIIVCTDLLGTIEGHRTGDDRFTSFISTITETISSIYPAEFNPIKSRRFQPHALYSDLKSALQARVEDITQQQQTVSAVHAFASMTHHIVSHEGRMPE